MLVFKHFSGFRMFTGLRELQSSEAIRMRQGRTKTFVLPIIIYMKLPGECKKVLFFEHAKITIAIEVQYL